MSLLGRIVDAFKPYRDEDVPEPSAFGVTRAGQERLSQLPAGSGVVLSRGSAGIVAREEPTADAVTVDGLDPKDLRGLLLDYEDGWRLAVDLSLRAAATPNPNGRLYTLNRRIAAGAASFYSQGTVNLPLPAALLAFPGVQSVLFRGHTVTVEREHKDIDWQRIDLHVNSSLQEYLLAAGPLIRSESPRYQDPFAAEVAVVLEADILPAVHRDGGDLRLIEVRDGVVRLAMQGACRSCPSSSRTLHRGVESVLKRRFGDRVRGVVAV
ncbi:MAG: NifU family protein [Myxococcota bacterium]